VPDLSSSENAEGAADEVPFGVGGRLIELGLALGGGSGGFEFDEEAMAFWNAAGILTGLPLLLTGLLSLGGSRGGCTIGGSGNFGRGGSEGGLALSFSADLELTAELLEPCEEPLCTPAGCGNGLPDPFDIPGTGLGG
jgi:hypothetical protein